MDTKTVTLLSPFQELAPKDKEKHAFLVFLFR
jgi:hypothetical protein